MKSALRVAFLLSLLAAGVHTSTAFIWEASDHDHCPSKISSIIIAATQNVPQRHDALSLLQRRASLHVSVDLAAKKHGQMNAHSLGAVTSFLEYLHVPETWSVLTFLILMSSLYLVLWQRVRSADAAEGARSCNIVIQGLLSVQRTIVIIDAFELANMLGGSVAYSGAIIGIFMGGSGVGFVVSWLLLNMYPDIWRRRMQCILFAAIICETLGAGGFAFTCFSIPTNPRAQSAGLRLFLLIARTVGGTGFGMASFMIRQTITRITPPQDQITQAVRLMVANISGASLGLMLAASAGVGASAIASEKVIGLQHLGVAGCLPQVLCFACLVLYPNIENEPDYATKKGSLSGCSASLPAAEAVPFEHIRIVWSCICMKVILAFMTSGLRATTALALQVHAGWTNTTVGWVLSSSCFMCIPVTLVYSLIKDALAPKYWNLILMSIAVVGSLFLYPKLPGYFIVLADFCIVPAAELCDGLLNGNIAMFSFPEGSLLHVTNRGLLGGILINGVASCLGPIIMRLIYQEYGMMGFANQQVGLAILCPCIFATCFGNFGIPPSSSEEGIPPKPWVVAK